MPTGHRTSRPTAHLPVRDLAGEIVARLRECPRLIVEAPTGSGKSTQVPQIVLDAGLTGGRQIVVLQPRRLAARMLARRVAWERGGDPGGEVGYQVRFDNRSGPATRIKYETEGVVLRQMLSDRELRSVGALVFDEFHERHVDGDVMLPLALELQRTTRPDLLVIVMSATLDTARLRARLEPCGVVRSEGRLYPVTVEYLDRPARGGKTPVWELAAAGCERLLERSTHGHALIFMPGAYEIRRTVEALRAVRAGRPFDVFPLYGELPPEAQDAAVGASERRKIVVSTNVAETSLTIDGVTLVIDSGLARKARFDPVRGIDTLLIERVSRASADQRAGRAGRTAPGHCLRLWTEAEQAALPSHETPEIRRIDLAGIVLTLKRLGIDEVAAFPWVDPPDLAALDRALGLLRDLGALSRRDGRLTPMGERMTAFPVHPRHALLLMEGEAVGRLPSAALLVALTQERDVLLDKVDRTVRLRREAALGNEEVSDHLLAIRAWRYARERGFAREACEDMGIHAQAARSADAMLQDLLRLARGVGMDTTERTQDDMALRRCILAAYSDRVARRLGPGNRRCEMEHGRRGTLDAESAARDGELLVISEVREIGGRAGEAEVRLSQATVIDRDWLAEMYPADLEERRTVRYDPETKRVTAAGELLFRGLVIGATRCAQPSPDEAAGALAEEVVAGRLALKRWDDGVEQWIARVNLVAEACSETGVAAVGDEGRRAIVQQICHGGGGFKDIREKDVMPHVRAWLAAAQRQAVETLAPERLTLSNGRKPRVVYAHGHPPHIALRVQELYDVTTVPPICKGRVRVLVHVLAPNQRPVQITDDLGSFWRNGYERVKKDLRGRYPRHEWR